MAQQGSEEELRKRLTPEQYRILREQGTEAPFTGALLHNTANGEYTCAACGNVVFKSSAKFDSTAPGLAGWPSFCDVAGSGAVELKEDNSHGMHRTEVVCKHCGSHLGHFFDDPDAPNGKHYCINSAALAFVKKD